MTFPHGLHRALCTSLLCVAPGFCTACVVDDAVVGLDVNLDARDASIRPLDAGSASGRRDAGAPDATDGSAFDASDPPVVYGIDADAGSDAEELDAGPCLPDSSLECPYDDGVLGPCDPRAFCAWIAVTNQPVFCDGGGSPTCWQDESGRCVQQCPPSSICTAQDGACAGEDYCYLEPGACNAAQQSGRCAPRPLHCPEERETVCGCDGVTYDNLCQAQRAGANVASDGPCP